MPACTPRTTAGCSDLGSTNGTRLNGWRVTTDVAVKPGDQVTFGSVSFVITDRPIGAD